MAPTLRLGSIDAGAMPADRSTLVRPYHDWASRPTQFRDEPDNVFRSLAAKNGTPVSSMQRQLRAIGFYPKGPIDGVFGYRTQSAARLFQEYVRTIVGEPAIGAADGIAGSKTHVAIGRWLSGGKKADWAPGDNLQQQIFAGLNRLKQRLVSQPPDAATRALTAFALASGTRKPAAWDFDPKHTHLLGIRRNDTRIVQRNGKFVRSNDDLFVLLINGFRVVFRGSTDPSPSMANRQDAAFLVRGQHEFRFGWHKLSSVGKNPVRVYRAFKPKSAQGVLIARANGGQLTPASYAAGVSANNTINIHWSGSGTSNWSAGCQVIAGKKYKNGKGKIIDLSASASPSYSGLGSKTRGAYNMLVDLATVFAKDIRPAKSDTLLYTLLYESDLAAIPGSAGIDFQGLVAELS